jgi:hypothetical protein
MQYVYGIHCAYIIRFQRKPVAHWHQNPKHEEQHSKIPVNYPIIRHTLARAQRILG